MNDDELSARLEALAEKDRQRAPQGRCPITVECPTVPEFKDAAKRHGRGKIQWHWKNKEHEAHVQACRMCQYMVIGFEDAAKHAFHKKAGRRALAAAALVFCLVGAGLLMHRHFGKKEVISTEPAPLVIHFRKAGQIVGGAARENEWKAKSEIPRGGYLTIVEVISGAAPRVRFPSADSVSPYVEAGTIVEPEPLFVSGQATTTVLFLVTDRPAADVIQTAVASGGQREEELIDRIKMGLGQVGIRLLAVGQEPLPRLRHEPTKSSLKESLPRSCKRGNEGGLLRRN